VVRDARRVERVAEAKAAGDADSEQLAIREINAGTYAFDGQPPWRAPLKGISNDKPRASTTCPTSFPACARPGHTVQAHAAGDFAVDDGDQRTARDLAAGLRPRLAAALLEAHMLAGVTVADPASTWIDAGVEIAADARIEPAPACAARPRSAPAPSSAR
jgi:bifunctional UDP-N-acetylglucosamine pyrophosphorylase/glucosamine-1-phosphate N-acetyltransferase